MTAFGYDNLPEDLFVEPLPDGLFNDALHALLGALNADRVSVREAKVAYIYDRKGFTSADSVAGPRNRSYGSDCDDVVIQLTARVFDPESTLNTGLSPLKSLIKRAKDAETQAKRERLEAEIEQAELEAKSLQELAEKKRAQLEEL